MKTTTAVLATLLCLGTALRAQEPERDPSFLVPGRTTLPEVIERWGTDEIRGATQWDPERVYLACDFEMYLEYPEIELARTYLDPPEIPEHLVDVASYSILELPGRDLSSLTRVPVLVVKYRRYLGPLEEGQPRGPWIDLVFEKDEAGRPGRLLYYAVQLAGEECGGWDRIVEEHGEPAEDLDYKYVHHRGRKPVRERWLFLCRYPEKGLAWSQALAGWVDRRFHFPVR